MKFVRIILDVELPNDFDEGEIDTALADTISNFSGQVIDSKEYKELDEHDE
jgi:hypothetical protein